VTETSWRLHDRREFLQRSLDDARREHEAGDLTDADYEALRQRDESLLAAIEASIAEYEAEAEVHGPDEEGTGPAPGERAVSSEGVPAGELAPAGEGSPGSEGVPASEGSPEQARPLGRRLCALRRRWWFVSAAIVFIVAGVFLLVHALTAPRLPGESATGTIDLNTAQKIQRQLVQARTLVRSGNASEALKVYGTVLSEDPRQPVALAEWGWLDWEAASKVKEPTEAAEGASALEESVRLDKRLFAAQYYLGTVLVQEGAPDKAVTHFAQFLADKPTATWLREAAPEIRTAYAAAHRPLPAGLPTS
jgi:tetratricopeptide (TPR) repeat protein